MSNYLRNKQPSPTYNTPHRSLDKEQNPSCYYPNEDGQYHYSEANNKTFNEFVECCLAVITVMYCSNENRCDSMMKVVKWMEHLSTIMPEVNHENRQELRDTLNGLKALVKEWMKQYGENWLNMKNPLLMNA